MSAKKDSSVLICGSCQHQNEPERVYCHNCGSKLDRSILPKPEEKKNHETPDKARARVQKMMSPNRGQFANEIKTAIKVVVFGAVLAAGYKLFQTPDGLPTLPEGGDYFAPRDRFTQQMEVKPTTTAVYTQDDVNLYLSKLKAADGGIPGVSFKGARVRLTPGTVSVIALREVGGMSTPGVVDYAPVLKDGKITAKVLGVHFGRLGILPAAGAYMDSVAVGSILTALKDDLKKINERVTAVEVGDGWIKVTTNTQP